MQAPLPTIRKYTDVPYVHESVALFDEDDAPYTYLVPVEYPFRQYYCVDCWVVDREGNVDPEQSKSPVPVRRENIGEPISYRDIE